jgi:hypothetical protein
VGGFSRRNSHRIGEPRHEYRRRAVYLSKQTMTRYNYSCATPDGDKVCGQAVTKDRCRTEVLSAATKPGKKKGRAREGKPAEKKFIGLHGWRCQKHGPTKVKRKMNKQEQS